MRGGQAGAKLRTRSAKLQEFARREPLALAGAVVLVGIVIIAILAPVIAPYGQTEIVGPSYSTPSAAHPLGLDNLGLDVLSLLLQGARISMLVGFLAAFIAVIIGGLVALLAGYYGGLLDRVLTAIVDYFLVIPILPLAVVVSALWGPSLRNEIIVIALLSWAPTTRIVGPQVKSLRQRTFVARARSVGASNLRVIVRHILPSVSSLLAASMVISVGNAVFFEAALSFLGLGDPTYVSWGRMIQSAFTSGAMSVGAWWAIVPPGLAIGIVIVSTSLVARALDGTRNRRSGSGYLGMYSFRVRSKSVERLTSQSTVVPDPRVPAGDKYGS